MYVEFQQFTFVSVKLACFFPWLKVSWSFYTKKLCNKDHYLLSFSITESTHTYIHSSMEQCQRQHQLRERDSTTKAKQAMTLNLKRTKAKEYLIFRDRDMHQCQKKNYVLFERKTNSKFRHGDQKQSIRSSESYTSNKKQI